MSQIAHHTPRRGFFDLPAEIRLLIYAEYCGLMRQELLGESDGLCNNQRACHRRSYADTMHVVEFKYRQSPDAVSAKIHALKPNPAYDFFVDMKLVSRQMRAEFVPVWLRRWVFQLPGGDNLYPLADDPEDFRQMKKFLGQLGTTDARHIRHLRLIRLLRAQEEPERAVEMETGSKLGGMLDGSGHDSLNDQLVVHIQVRCSETRPSNRRASKDVVFKRVGQAWDCVCDGPTTVSFERGWA